MTGLRLFIAWALAVPAMIIAQNWWVILFVFLLQIMAGLNYKWGDDE